ncbi:hypothetical protein V491_00482, partial [Pseudogymnoascus sp. VKM F-3775]
EKGHEAVAELLLDRGAEVDAKDGSGQTPLSWAAVKGYEVVEQLLLSREKAGKIWYATLTDSRIKAIAQTATFKQWADVTVDQANTLFGTSAAIIVRNAWVAVGVLV